MHLTRQELEDIWENKPYGYFAKMVKDLKGKKKYVVTTHVKKEVIVDTEVQTVWAKDAHSAQNLVHNTSVTALKRRLDGTLRRRLEVNQWDSSMSFSTKAAEAK